MLVQIDGYLDQSKLAAALRAVVGEDAWRGSEVQGAKPRRFRWDMVYAVDGQTVAVEYDGDDHYRDALKIKTDSLKDALARDLGWRVIRVPYWVQLTTETLRHYFGLDAEVRQSFPHGFITTKLFPASFCEMGVHRFERELAGLPIDVRLAVVESLRERCKEHGREFVLPTALAQLVE